MRDISNILAPGVVPCVFAGGWCLPTFAALGYQGSCDFPFTATDRGHLHGFDCHDCARLALVLVFIPGY